MSDTSPGPGWWQASDDRWYPPETHPDYQPPPQPVTAGLSDFEPPQIEQRFPTPTAPPPGSPPTGPPQSGGPVPGGYQPGVAKKRSNGKVLAIVFGVLFLLVAGGCGAFLYSFRDEIADATIDFSDSEVADEAASCEVTGVDFSGNFGIDVTLEANADIEPSHYQVTFEVRTLDGELLGADKTVLRSMEPGERRTEDAFNAIVGSEDVESVMCEVSGVRRVEAE